MAKNKKAPQSHYVTLMNVSHNLLIYANDLKARKGSIPDDHVMMRFQYPDSADGYAGAIIHSSCVTGSTNPYCSNILLHEDSRISVTYKDANHDIVTVDMAPRDIKTYFNEGRKAYQKKVKTGEVPKRQDTVERSIDEFLNYFSCDDDGLDF